MMKVSSLSKHSQKTWIEKIEERLNATSNMLSNMKAVKRLGLAAPLLIIVENCPKSRDPNFKETSKTACLAIVPLYVLHVHEWKHLTPALTVSTDHLSQLTN